MRMNLRALVIEHDPVLLQGREGRWRWPWVIAGMIATVVIQILLFGIAIAIVIAIVVAATDSMPARLLSEDMAELGLDPHEPYTFVLWLVVFPPMLVAPPLTLRLVHGVSWRRAFSFGGGFNWRQFLRAALAYFLVTAAYAGWSIYWEPQYFQFQRPGLDYVPWFVLALALIFVQSLGEEVLCKGYLLRVWGAVLPFRLPVVAAIIVLFVAAHIPNSDMRTDMGPKLTLMAFGEVLSFTLLFRTRNLAASAGLHWMNNVYALLLVGAPDSATEMTLSLYIKPDVTTAEYLLEIPLRLVPIFALLAWPRSPFYLSKPVP
jgi:membrane protease YdiL (CAAX protease family)